MTGLMGSFSGRIKRGTKCGSVVGEYWEMWARRPQGQVQFNTEGSLKQGCWRELDFCEVPLNTIEKSICALTRSCDQDADLRSNSDDIVANVCTSAMNLPFRRGGRVDDL